MVVVVAVVVVAATASVVIVMMMFIYCLEHKMSEKCPVLESNKMVHRIKKFTSSQ